MKIGIFDSGVGGLLIASAIRKKLPQYDYIYLGDTKRVPYGGRSHETVYEFTRQAVDYLFTKENCALVILACNTASARALRKIQQEYLPKNFPERKVLGVLIPAAEEAGKYSRVGVVATKGTVLSKTFINEIHKVNPKARVSQNPAPMLVPLAEEGERGLSVMSFIKKYVKPLMSDRIEVLVLGCTHYPFYKKEFKKVLGKKVKLVSQDEIVPKKLTEYLKKHPEVEGVLSKNNSVRLLFTDLTPHVSVLSKKWFTKSVNPTLVKL